MVPAPVLRPRAALLLALALAPRLADATVDAFNCTRAGTQPFQLLKATGDAYYSLKKLANGVYVDIYELDYTDASDINAAAMYTDADGNFYPYAVFDSQLCRFDKYSVHCYDGTMGVDLANAAAIVGGGRRPTDAHRDYFYYSNALGENEGDGLWYASDLDTHDPTFHDLTLPVNIGLFSSTVVDFAPITEDSGSDDIVADGVTGATYIVGMMYDFKLFIARLGDDGAPEAYAIVQGTGVNLEPIDKLFGAAWYLDTGTFDGIFFAGNGAEGLFTVATPIRRIDDDGCWNSGSDYAAHVACDDAVAVVVLYSTSTETPDNEGLNCPTNATALPTAAPAPRPTPAPTAAPVASAPAPTAAPASAAAPAPTAAPASAPTAAPASAPAPAPSFPAPSRAPSAAPTAARSYVIEFQMPRWMFTDANCDAYRSSDAITFANGQTVDGAALDEVLGGAAGAEFGDALCAGVVNASANATGANWTTAAPSAVDGRRLGGRRRLASCAYDAGEDAESFSLDVSASGAALGGDDDADDDAASSGDAAAEAAYASHALAYLENLTAAPDEFGDDAGDGGGDDGAIAQTGFCLALATAAAAPTAAPSLGWAASCGAPLYDVAVDGGDLLANNLGGRGPGNGSSATLRYGSVTYKDGDAVDLVLSVSAGTAYDVPQEPFFSLYQGRDGAFGQVLVRDNSTASLVFSFVDAATSEPVELEKFYVTFFDVDRQKKFAKHSEKLCVDAGAVDGYVLGENSELAVDASDRACDGSPGASLSFEATAAGFLCDNPSDPHVLEEISCADCDQCNASGGALDAYFPIDAAARAAARNSTAGAP
ncbi:hypothetical protein AURANDRAFT_62006 [Aureococcus anophagefferens]|uniref:Uncharacterized protein n=1 Tax=Aureococcus anophagefferens TaxID=44056 RepID=F0Y213_AURAN|nr:hypothetical protein AURANDRAFT_62006 [Aureococcus anophagefferens]EGB10621.1 hypothetical protein AURANDRAFT_62006 [Aureococcus anophagefferens]|eukprot:XP_009034224.1 hypothetical protein AURANDRAFT_62006 [Aureococcus anophagefferens]